MRTIYGHYTILETFEVPDDTTDDQIEDLVMAFAFDNGFIDLTNDMQWSERKEN